MPPRIIVIAPISRGAQAYIDRNALSFLLIAQTRFEAVALVRTAKRNTKDEEKDVLVIDFDMMPVDDVLEAEQFMDDITKTKNSRLVVVHGSKTVDATTPEGWLAVSTRVESLL